MKYLCLLFFVVRCSLSFAQIQKTYVAKDGSYMNDPKKAVAYLLVQKLGDSAFMAKKYDMRDTILFVGTYKDNMLTIPNGRFTIYNKKRLAKDKNAAKVDSTVSDELNIKFDTNNYVKMAGYYLNGKRTGEWVEYMAKGKKTAEYTYENDKLNGLCRTYNLFTGTWNEYEMVNDLLQGKYRVYTADSLLVSETEYDHNNIVIQTTHFREAKENDDFEKYLEKKLRKYFEALVKHPPTVKYTIDKTGKIINPQIVRGINPEVDAALIAAILSAPAYTPASYDDAPVERNIVRHFYLYGMLSVR